MRILSISEAPVNFELCKSRTFLQLCKMNTFRELKTSAMLEIDWVYVYIKLKSERVRMFVDLMWTNGPSFGVFTCAC